MSLGQLLDWLRDLRTVIAAQPDSEQSKQLWFRLIEGEVTLSAWRSALDRGDAVQEDQLLACKVAAEHNDMQQFLRAAGAVKPSQLTSAAYHALSFDRPWQQVLALEEVVLGAEARTVGFEEAARRRAGFRKEQRHALRHRLGAVIHGE